MKDVTIYTDDRIFGRLIESEIKKLGRSTSCHEENCILLIIDAESRNVKRAIEEIPHSFTLGISREIKAAFDFDACLKRPVSLKELRDTVKDILERKTVKSIKSTSEDDEIILLTDRKSVLFNGNRIALTPNEFILLEHLILNRGNAVSREKINELLCGDGNTADVYICMLRKKLTFNRRSPIVTLRKK